jgi:DNA-binding GntR family transcriptional regulator
MTTDLSADHGVLRLPLGSQVARAIRRDIILGRLRPGTVLVQERLCETYGVSRVPIRDALLTLLSEGFVQRNRRNQMVSAEWAPNDLIDTFHIEALLCGLAARLATANATEDELQELDELLQRGENAGDPPDRSITAEVSWQFHRGVNRAARSRRLITSLRAVSVSFVQDFMKEVPDWWCHSREQHRAILEAMRAREADRAEMLMREHFEEAGRHVSQFLAAHRAESAVASDGSVAVLAPSG